MRTHTLTTGQLLAAIAAGVHTGREQPEQDDMHVAELIMINFGYITPIEAMRNRNNFRMEEPKPFTPIADGLDGVWRDEK